MDFKKFFFVLFIAVVMLLVFLNFNQMGNIIVNVIYQIFEPFLKFFHWLGLKISNFFYAIISLNNLVRENFELQRENGQLLSENISLKETQKENEALKKIMDLSLSADSEKLVLKSRLILADIIGYNAQNFNQYILINKGIKDGLKKDLAVIDENGALVGKIFEANDYFSKVLLIIDPDSLINAIVQNDGRSQGIIKGEYGLGLILDMISLNDKIEEGQIVITAGSIHLPKGLPVGKIQEIIFRENDVFQKAIIKPVADFQKLERVFVIS